MARFKRGILGGYSGKVGTVAGGNWKGINYMRALPEHYTDPKTHKQVNQRSKFMYTLNFHQPFTEVLRIGFKAYAIKMSGFNAALSYNLKNAVMGEYPDFSIDLNKFLVSRGALTGAYEATCTATEEGKLNLNWENNTGAGNASGDDSALVVVYNPSKNTVSYFMDLAVRNDSGCVVSLPDTYSGDVVHCFLAFTNLTDLVTMASKKAISDSVYAGEVTMA
jgi:hypothetical protein